MTVRRRTRRVLATDRIRRTQLLLASTSRCTMRFSAVYIVCYKRALEEVGAQRTRK